MPTYTYACKDCEQRMDVVRSFSEGPLTECPSCGGTLRQVFKPAGIVFKGSGWHVKDYADAGSGGGGGAGRNGAGSTERSGGSSGAGSDAGGAGGSSSASGSSGGGSSASSTSTSTSGDTD